MLSPIALLLICLGVLLRLAEYGSNRSLWHDEAALALNIIDKSPLELFKPLAYDQVAPYGFLMVEKFAVFLFGNTEYALRFFPLILGIGSLLLFYALVKKVLGKKAVFIAFVLFVLSDALIYYASEVKQYGGDVAASLFIALIILRYLQKQSPTVLDWVMLIIAGMIIIWFSHPAIFVLAGMGFVLLLSALQKKRWKEVVRLCLIYIFWVVSFSIYYLLSLKFYISNKGLLGYHQATFAPLPISLSALDWYRLTFIELFSSFFSMPYAWIWIAFFFFGIYRLFQRNKITTFLLLSPILPALLASGMGKYPFFDRFLLFLIPTIFLFIGEGVYQAIRISKQKNQYIATFILIIIGFLFLQLSLTPFSHLFKPQKIEEIRPVMQFLQEHIASGDLIYVYYASEMPFLYYVQKYQIPSKYIKGMYAREAPSKYLFDLYKIRGNKRVWFLFSHVFAAVPVDEERFFLNYLDQIGRKLTSYKNYNAAIYLYDLTPKQQ